ncbi:hypothetical protein N0V90_006434 [Kalmusia sp. IMI 367209]|nr:hypothetical protein N0V90_006434 [Kalmusia sp. IMI 367209]
MLERLPDELLLQIARYILEPDDEYYHPPIVNGTMDWNSVLTTWCYGWTKSELLSITLVNQHIRAVTLEAWVAPTVSPKFRHLDSLIMTYIRYPCLAAKTKGLEIKTCFCNDSLVGKPKMRCDWVSMPVVPTNAVFVDACKSILRNDESTDCFDKSAWHEELRLGKTNGIFAVLFAILSNLERVNLQDASLYQFEFLHFLFDSDVSRLGDHGWHCDSEKKVFATNAQKIKELQLPSGCASVYWPHILHLGYRVPRKPVYSLACFTSLRRLVVPENTLLLSIRNHPPGTEIDIPDPHKMLPQALESLVISDVDFWVPFRNGSRYLVLEFLDQLFWQQQKSEGQHPRELYSQTLSNLKDIKIEYFVRYCQTDGHFTEVDALQEWNEAELMQQELQRIFKGLGGTLTFNFPLLHGPFDRQWHEEKGWIYSSSSAI